MDLVSGWQGMRTLTNDVHTITIHEIWILHKEIGSSKYGISHYVPIGYVALWTDCLHEKEYEFCIHTHGTALCNGNNMYDKTGD